MNIKVAIADDHPMMISSIENVLNTAGYFTVCGKFNNGEAIMNEIGKALPDILILDYHLPDKNGAEIARWLTYHHPEVSILALTGFEKPGLPIEMLESGCAGYLLKTSATDELLLKVIHSILEGKLYLDQNLKNKFTSNIQGNYLLKQKAAFPKLSKREMEILTLIVNELSSQEIANRLHVSKRTVDNHRSSILMKTGAKNNFALMKIAMQLKLI